MNIWYTRYTEIVNFEFDNKWWHNVAVELNVSVESVFTPHLY